VEPLAALALEVAALHREVDAAVERLVAAHGAALRCRRGCAGCCDDGLTVFEVEAEVIRQGIFEREREHEHENVTPRRGAREGPGVRPRCAFLGPDLECRIYDLRPYVCRTQGLPLRWLDDEGEGGEVVERRDVCPENDAGLDLLGLPEGLCWTIGPFEARLAALQVRADGNLPLRRVPLRALAGAR
jgi:Fe-S-cluster containining protein